MKSICASSAGAAKANNSARHGDFVSESPFLTALLLIGLSLTAFLFNPAASNLLEARPREVIRIAVAGHNLDVETARTPEARERGLKYRPSLCDTCGMLFVYPTVDRRAFYSKHVFLALDVAYFGADGRLLEVRTLAADTGDDDERPRTFPASQPFQYALAAPAGWFKKHRIRRHAVLELPHDLPAL